MSFYVLSETRAKSRTFEASQHKKAVAKKKYNEKKKGGKDYQETLKVRIARDVYQRAEQVTKSMLSA